MKCLMGAENDKLKQMSFFVKLFSTLDMWYKGPFQTKTSWQASPFFLFPFFYNPRIPRTVFWSFREGSVFSRQGNRLTWSWLSILWLYCVDRLSKQYAKLKIWNQSLIFKLRWRESQDMWKCSQRISWKSLGKSTCQSACRADFFQRFTRITFCYFASQTFSFGQPTCQGGGICRLVYTTTQLLEAAGFRATCVSNYQLPVRMSWPSRERTAHLYPANSYLPQSSLVF